MGGFQPLSIPIPAVKKPVETGEKRLLPLMPASITRRPQAVELGLSRWATL
jgi:hypothetical protein